MRVAKLAAGATAVLLSGWVGPGVAGGQSRAIDTARSSLKIRVITSGLFSAFAHNHVIEAPLEQGTVESSGSPSVALRVDARKLRVLDPDLSANKRAEVQKTMDGPEVLDSHHFPKIAFQSTAVEQAVAGRWTVRGNLTLHGQTRPVAVNVSLQGGHYRGSVALRQREIGTTPVSIAGGTVQVKDEVKVEFDIVLAQ